MLATGVCASILTDHDLVYQGLAAILIKQGICVQVTRAEVEVAPAADVVLYDVSRFISHGPKELDQLLQEGAPVLVLVCGTRLVVQADLLTRSVGWVEVSMSATEIAAAVLRAATGHLEPGAGPPWPDHALSDRETQIIRLIAQGFTNHEIAAKLFLSPNTVKTYIRTAYRKLDVTRRSQAVLWAARQGYLESTTHAAASSSAAS